MKVAGTGRSAADNTGGRRSGRDTRRNASDALDLADLTRVAGTARSTRGARIAAHSGAIASPGRTGYASGDKTIGRTRSAGPRAGLRRVAFAGRGAARGSDKERIRGTCRASARASLRLIAGARRSSAGRAPRGEAIGGTCGARAIALFRRIARARGGPANGPRSGERIGRTINPRSIADLGTVAAASRRAAFGAGRRRPRSVADRGAATAVQNAKLARVSGRAWRSRGTAGHTHAEAVAEPARARAAYGSEIIRGTRRHGSVARFRNIARACRSTTLESGGLTHIVRAYGRRAITELGQVATAGAHSADRPSRSDGVVGADGGCTIADLRDVTRIRGSSADGAGGRGAHRHADCATGGTIRSAKLARISSIAGRALDTSRRTFRRGLIHRTVTSDLSRNPAVARDDRIITGRVIFDAGRHLAREVDARRHSTFSLAGGCIDTDRRGRASAGAFTYIRAAFCSGAAHPFIACAARAIARFVAGASIRQRLDALARFADKSIAAETIIVGAVRRTGCRAKDARLVTTEISTEGLVAVDASTIAATSGAVGAIGSVSNRSTDARIASRRRLIHDDVAVVVVAVAELTRVRIHQGVGVIAVELFAIAHPESITVCVDATGKQRNTNLSFRLHFAREAIRAFPALAGQETDAGFGG